MYPVKTSEEVPSTTKSTDDQKKQDGEIIMQPKMRHRDDDKERGGGAESKLPIAVEATAVIEEEGVPPVIKAIPVEGVPFVCCPFGGWSVVLPLGLGYLASILAIGSIFSCYLVGNILWGYNCYRFVPASSFSYEDVPFQYGRIASFVGGIGGLIYTGLLTGLLSCTPTTMMGSFSQKRRLPSTTLMGIGYGVLSGFCFSALIASLTNACHDDDTDEYYHSQGLDPRHHQQNRYCEVGPGMILSMISGLFFVGAAISLCLLGRNRS